MKEIFERMSIRKYKDTMVEDDKITQILKAAMQAPSAGNQQPWEFFVVRDKNVISQLSKCSKFSGCANNANVVIVPCFKTKDVRFPELVEIDLAIATQNILLEITSLGLGGVFLSVAPYKDRMECVDNILNLDEGLHSFAIIPIGYSDENRTQVNRFDTSKIHRID